MAKRRKNELPSYQHPPPPPTMPVYQDLIDFVYIIEEHHDDTLTRNELLDTLKRKVETIKFQM